MNTSLHRRHLPLIRWLWHGVAILCACLGIASAAPRIGYVYPAGGQRGTTFEVLVGGQSLDGPVGALISGGGIQTKIVEHIKPLSAQAAGDMHEKLREKQAEMRELRTAGKITPAEVLPTIRRLLREAGLTDADFLRLTEYDRRRNDPKQQQNVQIGETVRVSVTIAENAEPGLRQWRLRTASGLSNPMRFAIGQHPEANEAMPPMEFDFEAYSGGAKAARKAGKHSIITPPVSPPVTINGRILPGEVDKFTFHARKDQQIVLAVQARQLIPYLADAVPGWFQAVVALFDASGHELAFADGYRFDPDPVLFYKIPEDGDYRIEVHDSIYRGREDFIYRITVGELPFLTGISPLGAKAGSIQDLTFLGGNLGDQFKQHYTAPDHAGIVSLHATRGPLRSNLIPFHIDTGPEVPEREPNNSLGRANEVTPPVIINGRIDTPGDEDFFRLKGTGNKPMVFEIFARRLGSPVDSSLTIFDTDGKQLAFNDDHDDPAAGLTTHQADSRISLKMPTTGECIVRVADTQNQGGISYAYRLKIAPAHPGFALRVTPSTLNAKPGGSAKLTVHALRVDGFEGEIALQLKGAKEYFALKNARVPADKDLADIWITVPPIPSEEPTALIIEGKALVDGHPAVVDAVPAEDMMQAFIYRHLVPVDELLVDVRTPPEKPAK